MRPVRVRSDWPFSVCVIESAIGSGAHTRQERSSSLTATTTPWKDHAGTSANYRHTGAAGGFKHSTTAGSSTLVYPSPRDTTKRTDRVIVLLISRRSTTSAAIQRASRLSDAIAARLLVVLAIPDDAAPEVSLATSTLRASSPRRGHELEVVHGDLAEIGYEISRAEGASIVVVDDRLGAKEACRLADRLTVPVLVARDARAGGDWIAASDMKHLEFPVLATARGIAQALDRDVIYFHNAKPLPVLVHDPMAGPGTYAGMLALQDDVAAAKRARLATLASPHPRVRSVVTRAVDTVGVLVDLARDRDADMVVIGHAPHRWWRRLVRQDTTEQLVRRTRRSVLIVPLTKST